MKRVGFILKISPDRVQEYKELHRAVWPEMMDALRRNGWSRYSLFMGEDGLLFGYFETPESFGDALERMSKEEVNHKWQELVAPYVDNPNGAHADESMQELVEVFHLD